jgi:hypothetical protein
MDDVIHQTGFGGGLAPAAYVAVLAVALSCASLVLLHLLSPEFAPSWRMVSEYANGQHRWLLTFVFTWWALSSFALLAALWPASASALGKAGLLFLLLAGVGQAMGALFDVNHPLHGAAAMIGIPSLCLAAVLLNAALGGHPGIEAPPRWAAHLPWISFALMIGTLLLLFSALRSAGIEVGPKAQPLEELPPGVSGYVGWANRLLFAASYLWVALAALAVLRAKT